MKTSMKVLVAKGANTEAIDEEGRTPLFSAIAIKEIEMVKVRCEWRDESVSTRGALGRFSSKEA